MKELTEYYTGFWQIYYCILKNLGKIEQQHLKLIKNSIAFVYS
jgi:hypothetical protein